MSIREPASSWVLPKDIFTGLTGAQTVMLEEARSVLRIELLMELLDSDWHRHCYASSKEGRHPPDWLTKLVRRCDLNTVSISDALSVLIRDVSIPTAGTDDFWCVWDWASSFKAMMQDFKAKHEKAARLCVRCVRPGADHRFHQEGGE